MISFNGGFWFFMMNSSEASRIFEDRKNKRAFLGNQSLAVNLFPLSLKAMTSQQVTGGAYKGTCHEFGTLEQLEMLRTSVFSKPGVFGSSSPLPGVGGIQNAIGALRTENTTH